MLKHSSAVLALVVVLDSASTTCVAGIDIEWIRHYGHEEGRWDYATSVAVDSLGNAYVAGSSWRDESELDIVILKYASSGELVWSRRYDGPSHGEDRGKDVEFGSDGKIYIAGITTGTGTKYDFTTLCYDSSGNLLWDRRFDFENEHNPDEPMQITQSGNLIAVAGRSEVGKQTFRNIVVLYTLDGDSVAMATGYPKEGEATRPIDLASDRRGGFYCAMYDQQTDMLLSNLVHIDSSGVVAWQWMGMTDSTVVLVRDLAVDSKGRPIVAGAKVILGISESAWKPYVAVLSEHGKLLRDLEQLGGAIVLTEEEANDIDYVSFWQSLTYATDIYVDSTGRLLVLGVKGGNSVSFAALLDSSLQPLWQTTGPSLRAQDEGIIVTEVVFDGVAYFRARCPFGSQSYFLDRVSLDGEFVAASSFLKPVTGLIWELALDYRGDIIGVGETPGKPKRRSTADIVLVKFSKSVE